MSSARTEDDVSSDIFDEDFEYLGDFDDLEVHGHVTDYLNQSQHNSSLTTVTECDHSELEGQELVSSPALIEQNVIL